LNNHEVLLERHMTHEIEEEAFPAAESSHDQSKGCSTIAYPRNVLEERFGFSLSAHLDKMKPLSGDKAGLKGLKDRIALASFDLHKEFRGWG